MGLSYFAKNSPSNFSNFPDTPSQPDLATLLAQIQKSPSDPELHFKLGIAYGVSGNQKGAIVEFQKAIEFESKVQDTMSKITNFRGTPYLHRDCKPLATVEFNSKNQGDLFQNECEGICGV